MTKLIEALQRHFEQELHRASDQLIGDTIGVTEAIALLRRDLEQLSRHLDARGYESAAQMGYESIARNFIFLQRCLGGLVSGCNDRDQVIQEIARERGTSFDEERPGAYAIMPAMQLNPSDG